jgi:hypothetical protein
VFLLPGPEQKRLTPMFIQEFLHLEARMTAR